MFSMDMETYNFSGHSQMPGDNIPPIANFGAAYNGHGVDFTISINNIEDDDPMILEDFSQFKEQVFELVRQIRENKNKGEAE